MTGGSHLRLPPKNIDPCPVDAHISHAIKEGDADNLVNANSSIDVAEEDLEIDAKIDPVDTYLDNSSIALVQNRAFPRVCLARTTKIARCSTVVSFGFVYASCA